MSCTEYFHLPAPRSLLTSCHRPLRSLKKKAKRKQHIMKYLFVIAGKNVKTHHALVRLQTGFNHSFSLNDFYTTYLSLYHTTACPPHAPTDAPALKTSAQSPTRSLWRHQNGMSKSGLLIGPFVPRDTNTPFWLVTRYTAPPYYYLSPFSGK